MPNSADDEVLRARRLVVDDEAADRGDERLRAEEPGDELRHAERGEGRDDPGDRGVERADAADGGTPGAVASTVVVVTASSSTDRATVA